jgi:multicomponent K+:H+ antiporter subunit G
VNAFTDIAAGLLLLASGVLSLIGAFGLLRLPEFFQRMHAPALVTTLGTWCAALASIVRFWSTDFGLRSTVIVVLLALTTPVTTVLLSRATLFRRRTAEGAERPGAGD